MAALACFGLCLPFALLSCQSDTAVLDQVAAGVAAADDNPWSDARLAQLTLRGTERRVRSAPDQGPTDTSCRGCAVQPSDPLTPAQLTELLQRFAASSLPTPGQDYDSISLDILLFHRDQLRQALGAGGAAPSATSATGPKFPELPAAHRRFLHRASAAQQVRLGLHIIDDQGRERARLVPRTVTLGEKSHLHFSAAERSDLEAFEVSGTIVRVGLYHLWSRL